MSEPKSNNITWHHAELSNENREAMIGQKGCVLWFTGLSGSGKSTVSRRVERKLLERGIHAYGLDGDNLRHGLNADLGFTEADRTENVRRVAHLAHLFADSGLVCLTAFISPYRADRASARALLPEGRFVEVHVATSLQACESRDPKGLYQRARAGQIPNFTGIDAPYEAPENAEIVLDTEANDADACADQVLAWLTATGLL